MTIWIVNLFDEFPKEGEYPARIVALARTLVGRGHDVVWWTSDWSHRYKCPRTAPDDCGFTIRALATVPYHSNSGLKRVWSHSRFARTLTQHFEQALRQGEAPEAIYVNLPVPVVAAAVARFKRRSDFRMTVDIRDAWPENFLQVLPSGLGLRRWFWPLLLAPFRRDVRRAIAAADSVTAVSQDYLDLMYGYGLAQGSGKVFYIGTTDDRLDGIPVPMAARIENPAEPLQLVYIGGFGASYDLATLGDAMAKWHAQPTGADPCRVHLHLAGYGEPPAWAKQLSNVTFHGMLELAPLRQLLERCHIGMNTVHAGSGIAMPNKIGEYLAAALPVIHSRTEGELAQQIRHHNMGTCYPAGDATALQECIAEYATPTARPRLIHQSTNARTFAEQYLDRRKIYAGLADVIEGNLTD